MIDRIIWQRKLLNFHECKIRNLWHENEKKIPTKLSAQFSELLIASLFQRSKEYLNFVVILKFLLNSNQFRKIKFSCHSVIVSFILEALARGLGLNNFESCYRKHFYENKHRRNLNCISHNVNKVYICSFIVHSS